MRYRFSCARCSRPVSMDEYVISGGKVELRGSCGCGVVVVIKLEKILATLKKEGN